MKTVPSTSSSSSMKSTTTIQEDRSEFRDSCYYPGCRKDANCNCEICLASINATLDLIQKSSLTKFSASRPTTDVERTPISFNSSILSTPISTSPPRITMSPSLRSSGKSSLNFNSKKETRKEKRKWGGPRSDFYRLALVLSLIFMADYGFSRTVSGIVKPALSPDLVRNVGEKSWGAVKDLNGKLRLFQKELQGLVHGEVSNCSYANSAWKISQDGLLLSSHCTFYKSAMEEISIWGWPLQTAGLLKTGFSSRSFTVMSGRVTEWSDGKIGYVIRKVNSSWEVRKWGASAVQLDRNTWILEYRRSSILDNPRLVSAAIVFFKYKVEKMVGKLKQEFWLFSAFDKNSLCHFTGKCNLKVPT
ncbi:hypothetical protein FEM48_Zijuj07G0124000 [Ziziphus jujuba var. spinosa]|uniref:ERG2/sigma1 receptor-like protein n=1 Tax=Ziziphus jujuba var. spinosa TaxID=714518 RepID=A0A978V4M0_ZIZJJ|nr:hypothetical protein FEM48_Zijuj07G0124000 [Ziziphus jujuba var. spinosa]